jgi:hypothetical protein
VGNNPKLHVILGHKQIDIMTIFLMLVAIITFSKKLEKERGSSIWKHKLCSNKIKKTRKPTIGSLSVSIALTNAYCCYKKLIWKLKIVMWRCLHNNQQTKCTYDLKMNKQQTKQTTNYRTTTNLKITMWRWMRSDQQTKCVNDLKISER